MFTQLFSIHHVILHLLNVVYHTHAKRSYEWTFSTINSRLFPLFRVQAVGLLIAVSRVGAAFSPFIMTGLKYINDALPFALLGLLNFLVGLFCLHLRETNNAPSPDTIDDCLILMKKKGAEHPH